MVDSDKAATAMYIAALLLLTFALYKVTVETQTATAECRKCEYCEYITGGFERGKLYNLSNKNYAQANGVYFSDSYYCVWTGGREKEEMLSSDPVLRELTTIQRTALHEYLHAIIRQHGKEHFCNITNK